MKFEQAFYTFGLNQMSRYKEGLGICAASRLDQSFLDRCLSLGSRFVSEYTPRTAKFTLYSKEFKAFVGVGISPRKDGGDGRTNKLCHFFIPAESGSGRAPEQYLLDYPFWREVADHAEIGQADLEPAVYGYHDILEKYALHGDKLAMLLWKAYLCAFDEAENLTFVIDRARHEIEEHGQIAREIIWLVSVLLPVPEGQKDLYRNRISYGVYTYENRKAVRFIFTDREDMGGSRFYVDRGPESADQIPQVYKVMAGWAEESREAFQEKLEGMMRWQFSKRLQSDHLLMMYFRWRLEENEGRLSYQELQDEMNRLQVRAMGSPWHKQFLIKYLKQEERMDIKGLVSVWTRFIRAEMESYADMGAEGKQDFEEAVTNVVCMMRGQSNKNYHILLDELSKTADLEDRILHNIYFQRAGKEYIDGELEKCGTTEQFCTLASGYSALSDVDGLKETFFSQALLRYEPASKEDRSSISCAMEKLDQKAWEKKMWAYTSNGCKGLNPYIVFLETEMDRIEAAYAEMHYSWLLYPFQKKEYGDQRPDWRRIRDNERKLQEIGTISETLIKKLDKYITDCEKKEILEQINGENLEDHAGWEIGELKYDECKRLWIQRINEELKRFYPGQKERISEKIFQKLLHKMEDVISWGQSVQENQLYKNYLDGLIKVSSSDWRRRLQVHFALCRRGSAEIRLPDFWKNICRDDFEELYTILKDNKDLYHINNSEVLCEKSVFIRECYRIWECTKEDQVISIDMDYSHHAYKDDWKDSIKKYKGIISKKEEPGQKDIYNFIILQLAYEELCGENPVTARGICKSIRKLREKRPSFAKTVQDTPLYGKDEKVTGRWEDMKALLDIMDHADKEEIPEGDVCYVRKLLERCPDRFADEPEVKKLLEGIMEINDREKEKLEREKENLQKENQGLRQENQMLGESLKRMSDLESKVKAANSRIDKLEKVVEDMQRDKADIDERISSPEKKRQIPGDMHEMDHSRNRKEKEESAPVPEEERVNPGIQQENGGRGPEMRRDGCVEDSQAGHVYPKESQFTGSRNDVDSGRYN